MSPVKITTEPASTPSKPLTSLLSTLSLSKKDLDDQSTKKSSSPTGDPFIQRLTLDDFEHLSQLGMGGFGIVNMVCMA